MNGREKPYTEGANIRALGWRGRACLTAPERRRYVIHLNGLRVLEGGTYRTKKSAKMATRGMLHLQKADPRQLGRSFTRDVIVQRSSLERAFSKRLRLCIYKEQSFEAERQGCRHRALLPERQFILTKADSPRPTGSGESQRAECYPD